MKDTGRPFTLSWVAALIGFGLVFAGVFLAKAANSTTMVPGYLAAIMVVVMALLALGRTRLQRRRETEAEQLAEYRRTHGATDLFEDADEAVRLAARASEQYVKYFVPAITVVLGGLLLTIGSITWRGWTQQAPNFPVADRPLAMAAISLALFIGSIIAASFFVGVSREDGCRWLRAPGSWMFFTGLIFLGNAFVLGCEHFNRWTDVVDIRVARVAMVLLLILAAELLVSVIIEFYRPRMPGEELHPIAESRLLALFTEPGGVARNLAASLDYQFGFQVSEAKFYRFLERTLVPSLALLALLLWLQTCLVIVKADENGLRERFGKIAPEPLLAGSYLKLPTPFEKIHRFPVHRVQKIALGYTDNTDTEDEEAAAIRHDVIIWSRRHRKEETKFIVASKLASESRMTGDTAGNAPVSVYSLSASVPLYFRVENLYDYEYRHLDASKTLQRIASREIMHYFSSVDFFTVLTAGREEGAAYLAERIQQQADHYQLGIRIVYVGLQGLHPPVEVGAKFDEVAASSEEREEIILKAEAYSTKKVLGAQGEQAVLISEAEAYRQDKIQNSAAIASRFAKQLLGYQQSPQLFVLNNLLDVLENEGSHVRKFVVAANGGRQVFILDLIEKATSGLLNLAPDEDAKTDENKTE
jgi:regulator of protease activity HflC (stomatin/prohibitin superfamily)